MEILANKLQNIYSKINFLLYQLKIINVAQLKSLPLKIKDMIIGDNKMSSYIDKSIQEINFD